MTAPKGEDVTTDVQDATPLLHPAFKIIRLEDVAAATELKRQWVPIPEWAPRSAGDAEAAEYGCFARALNGRERAEWQTGTVIAAGKNTAINFRNATLGLVIAGACDEKGNRIFRLSDEKMLMARDSAILERIADVVSKLSGIGEDEIETVVGKGLSLTDDSTTD